MKTTKIDEAIQILTSLKEELNGGFASPERVTLQAGEVIRRMGDLQFEASVEDEAPAESWLKDTL